MVVASREKTASARARFACETAFQPGGRDADKRVPAAIPTATRAAAYVRQSPKFNLAGWRDFPKRNQAETASCQWREPRSMMITSEAAITSARTRAASAPVREDRTIPASARVGAPTATVCA